MLTINPDIVGCIAAVTTDNRTLLALSLLSSASRVCSMKHTFRRIHYVSSDSSALSLEQFCEALDEIQHLFHHVKEFSISPSVNVTWGNPVITSVTLCSLCAIIRKFPGLQTLELRCCTWKACSQPHNCLGGMNLLALDWIKMYQIRVVGSQDPLAVLRIARSLDNLMLLDILPTAPLPTTNSTVLTGFGVKTAYAQVLMDSRTVQTPNDQQGKVQYYNNHAALKMAFQASPTLTHLRLVWQLSHTARAPFPQPALDLDLSECTALRAFYVSISARPSAYDSLASVALTVASLPPSTSFLCVHVDVALRSEHDEETSGFDDKHGYWALLWQVAAVKGTIRSIMIHCWDNEHSSSRFTLVERDDDWETDLLHAAEKTLGDYGYTGVLETGRIVDEE